MHSKKHILPIIVIAQFCCTSLWFAGNGVMADLIRTYALEANAIGHLTAAVQFGFICGTLIFAILTIADRFSPSKVFFTCALLGAFFNAWIIWPENNFMSLLLLRFLTGVFLAGIYPVGMKIAADYFEKGLGKSLGFLVGALVLGTAFPHLLKGITEVIPWNWVIISTSILALLGGSLMIFLVSNGPHRKPGMQFDYAAFLKVFANRDFRAAALGYFGHMWELYAFWAFVPIILQTYSTIHPETNFDIPLLSFLIIGIGGFACVFSGLVSQRVGTERTAFTALLLSGCCCLLSPFAFGLHSQTLFLAFLLFWGFTVIADSPLFSTLVANNAMPSVKGTALTIVNCIGFAITIGSIQLINSLTVIFDSVFIYLILAIGPLFGLLALRRKF